MPATVNSREIVTLQEVAECNEYIDEQLEDVFMDSGAYSQFVEPFTDCHLYEGEAAAIAGHEDLIDLGEGRANLPRWQNPQMVAALASFSWIPGETLPIQAEREQLMADRIEEECKGQPGPRRSRDAFIRRLRRSVRCRSICELIRPEKPFCINPDHLYLERSRPGPRSMVIQREYASTRYEPVTTNEDLSFHQRFGFHIRKEWVWREALRPLGMGFREGEIVPVSIADYRSPFARAA